MAEKRKDITSKVQAHLKQLQSFDISVLERKELGPASFAAAVSPAKQIIDMAKEISLDDVKEFPKRRQQNLLNLFEQVIGMFNKIIGFDFSAHSHPGQVRDQYVNELEDRYGEFFEQIMPLVSYLRSKRNDFGGTEKMISEIVESIKKSSKLAQEEMQKQLNEATSLIAGIKNASAQGGTLEQAKHFREEKLYHKDMARWWCAGTIISVIVLISYTLLSFRLHDFLGVNLKGTNTQGLILQLQTTKILIFAVLAYLLMLSARNFMSHKHNMVINSHREVALHTFEALAKAANNDEGARDIILTHAASCIFSPQETGYAKSSASLEGGANLGGASFILNLAKRSAGKDEGA